MPHILKKQLAKLLIKTGRSQNSFNALAAEEHRIPENAEPNYNDSYYFSGHDNDKNAIICRLAFRGDGETEIWFSLLLSDGTIYDLKSTKGFTRKDRGYGPLQLTCVEPEKKWTLSFNGNLESNGKPVKVSVNAEFTSPIPILDFASHMPVNIIAEPMANEKWTRQWFEELRGWHQTHYEQYGTLSGSITVNSKKIDINMKGIRDHSFGPRDWNQMERHIWLAMAFDDGTFINYSTVTYPILKNICAGFHQKKDIFIPVLEGPKLKDLGADGNIPQQFSFELLLKNGNKLKLTCENEVFFSWDMAAGGYRLTEGVARYTANGISGRGICEFGYNRNYKDKQ